MSDRLRAAATRNPGGFHDLLAHHAVPHLGQVRVIDVREPDEFTGPLGRLPNAELVPLATVPQTAQAWDRDEVLIVVCRSGGRSGRAAQFLAAMGFRNVFNLVGGMLHWDAQGLPRHGGSAPVRHAGL